MLAALLTLSLAHCTPPEPEESRRMHESVYLQRPTTAEGALAARNTRLFLSGPVGLLLDESEFGPPVLTIALKDAAGAPIAFTRMGNVVFPDALLPALSTITLEVRLTADHPCPDCATPRDDTFSTSALVDSAVESVSDKESFEVTMQDAMEGPCSFVAERTVAMVRVAGSISEPLFATVIGGRRGHSARLGTGHVQFGTESESFIGGTLADPAPMPGERVVLAVVVEDLAGNRALSSVSSVAVTDIDKVGASTCTMSAPALLDVPARVPKNAVIRTRFPVETRTPTLAASDDMPLSLLATSSDPGEQRVYALPADIAAGSFTLDVAPCASCACPECVPEARTVEIENVDDTEPPLSPSVLTFTFTERDAASSDAFCFAIGRVIEVVFAPGRDDKTARADLRYDVKARVNGGPSRILARALAPVADGEEDVLIVPSSSELIEAGLTGEFVLELVARDLADHESEAAGLDRALALGCAHVDVRTGVPAIALFSLFSLSMTHRRRRR
jgi:hypothetical protein